MKKKLIISAIMLGLAVVVSANWLVQWDPASPVVPNRVIRWMESVNPDASNNHPNSIVVDTIPPGLQIGTYKWTGTEFVPLTQQDNDAIAATNALNQFLSQQAFTNAVMQSSMQGLDDRFDELALMIKALAFVMRDYINASRAPLLQSNISKATLRHDFTNALGSFNPAP